MGWLPHSRVGVTRRRSLASTCHRRLLAVVLMVMAPFWATGCSDHRHRIEMRPLDEMPVISTGAVQRARVGQTLFGPQLVQLKGAINEVVSFRFALRSVGADVPRPRLRVMPFVSSTARMAATSVQIYRMEPLTLDTFPGWHLRSVPTEQRVNDPLDVLVPIDAPHGGLPDTLRSDQAYVFWVEVTIPKGTAAATYGGKIELTSGDRAIAALPIELTVWPFILPDEGDVVAIAAIDHEALLNRGGQASDGSLLSMLRLLQTHRLTPVLPDLTPTVKIDARGEVVVDWERYDAVVAPCLSGHAFPNRVPLSLWPIPLGSVFSSARASTALSSPGYGAIQRQYMELCARHFEKNDWLARCYAMAPSAVPSSSQAAHTIDTFAAAVHATDNRLATVSRLWPQDMSPYGWVGYRYTAFGDAVDVWMPPAQFFDVQEMAGQRTAGRRTWLAIDGPPFSGTTAACARSADVRVLSWQADQLGCEAYHVGYVNRWPLGGDNPTPARCVRNDPGTLIYPGKPYGLDQPVASVRLKYLQQTQQDAAYRSLLTIHGLGHIPETLSESLVGQAGSDAYRTHFADGRQPAWPIDPGMYDLAREIMAGELLHALRGREHPDDLARTTNWRRFMLGTRRLSLDVDGVRFHVSGSRADWQGQIACTMTIANRRRVPVAGTARLAGLPAIWATGSEEKTVPAIPPNTSRRLTLTANTTSMPASGSGHIPLLVEFASEDGTTHQRAGHVACIVAQPCERPVRIDGDLSDWPPGSGNVAAEFRPIASPIQDAEDGEFAGTERNTLALVMRDGSNLYIAINCTHDGTIPTTDARRNTVQYDDMIPVGEELIEILLDPLNSGTRSPTDLYHIAVKPSGTYLLEKGIAFDPPCGRREPWPAGVEIATAAQPGRWTAEVRIPLAAFGTVPSQHTVWGFNVTRLDSARQLFSTWSGAEGNAYDPLSLGNLYLP